MLKIKTSKRTKYIIAIFIILAITFTFLQVRCTSIEKYVTTSKFTNVTIHKINSENNILLFSAGKKDITSKQYILTRIRNFKGYYFDLYEEEGWTYQGPSLFRVSHKNGIGNVVWGALDLKEEVKRLEIEYINMKNDEKYFQEVKLKENAFLEYLPDNILNEDFTYGDWKYSIEAYNINGELIHEEIREHIPYQRRFDY